MVSWKPWSRSTSVRRDANSQEVIGNIDDGNGNTVLGTRARCPVCKRVNSEVGPVRVNNSSSVVVVVL